MESNLFPIFLIGFLLSIVLLLQKSSSSSKYTKNHNNKKDTQTQNTKTQDTKTQDTKAQAQYTKIQALAQAQARKTAKWHKLKISKEKVPEVLFSNEWQNQFKQYNEKLPNNNYETTNPIFNTTHNTWDGMTLTSKETFTNQGSYINSFAQKEAMMQHVNPSKPYLVGYDSPISATEYEIGGGEHFWALQNFD